MARPAPSPNQRTLARVLFFLDLRKPEDLRIEPGAYVQVAYEQRDMVQIERVRHLLTPKPWKMGFRGEQYAVDLGNQQQSQ